MSTKSREVICGSRIAGAKIKAEAARKRAVEAAREADGGLWRTGAAVPNDRAMPQWRVGWLQVKCHRCSTEASLPLDAIRRPRDTPIWKLEAALKCRSCRTPRYSPRVHMIKLTMQREIMSYTWVHPDDDDRR
jgi:hypothetical protein